MASWTRSHIGLRPNVFRCLNSSTLVSLQREIWKNLHVGVLGGGDLGAVGQVDVGLLGERSIDVFVVDVLDHWLKIGMFDYQFKQF